MMILRSLMAGLLFCRWAAAADTPSAATPAAGGEQILKVRPGYHVELLAQNIGEVRFIEFGDNGTLYVSQPRAGTIAALREVNGRWTKVADFTTGKPTVHGLCFHDGWLWFSQSGTIWKARDTDGDGKADEETKVTEDLPSNGTHWWRSILVAGDHFYTSIGDSGNATDETASERQKVWRFNLDGSGKTLFASGIRNTEKLRLRPGTEEVWGVDHGSDNWGQSFGEQRGNQPFTDHLPGEKFNHYVEGAFYGHPFIVGNGLPRLEFRNRPDFLEWANKTTLPAWTLPAHWAPNGWNFLQRDTLGLRGDALIACHGSWNSTLRVGYRLERVMFDPMTGQPMGNQMIVSMLGDSQQILGRPCDVAEAPDGAVLFSDDGKGRIYRLTRDPSSEIAHEMPAPVPQPLPPPSLPSVVAEPSAALPVVAHKTASFAALDYFQSSCARCHGDYGSIYGHEFRGKLDDDALREMVLRMSEGQAQAPITADQREAVVGFLRSLRDDHPYGTVVSRQENSFTGEASPGAKLWLESGAGRADVPLNGHTWQSPTLEDPKDTRLHVQKDGKEIVLPLTEALPAS